MATVAQTEEPVHRRDGGDGESHGFLQWMTPDAPRRAHQRARNISRSGLLESFCMATIARLAQTSATTPVIAR